MKIHVNVIAHYKDTYLFSCSQSTGSLSQISWVGFPEAASFSLPSLHLVTANLSLFLTQARYSKAFEIRETTQQFFYFWHKKFSGRSLTKLWGHILSGCQLHVRLKNLVPPMQSMEEIVKAGGFPVVRALEARAASPEFDSWWLLALYFLAKCVFESMTFTWRHIITCMLAWWVED